MTAVLTAASATRQSPSASVAAADSSYWPDIDGLRAVAVLGRPRLSRVSASGTRIPFLDGGDTLALGELEALLKQLSATKVVYLLIDSPKSPALSPKSYLEGSPLPISG